MTCHGRGYSSARGPTSGSAEIGAVSNVVGSACKWQLFKYGHHRPDKSETAEIHPTSPFVGTIAGVRFGARRPVPAAKAERPLCDQTGDLRRDARQWARCADSGRSLDERNRSGRPIAVICRAMLISPIDNLWWAAPITV